ncbi:hypothetical protein V8F20_008621 [Naviculisporaceae sp. PSN 640]
MSAPFNGIFGTMSSVKSQLPGAGSTDQSQSGHMDWIDGHSDDIRASIRGKYQATVTDEEDEETTETSGSNLGTSAPNAQTPAATWEDIVMDIDNSNASGPAPLTASQKITLKRREARRRKAERRRANMMAVDQPDTPSRAPKNNSGSSSSALHSTGPSQSSKLLTVIDKELGASPIRKVGNIPKPLPDVPSKAENWSAMSSSSRNTLRRKMQRRRQMESEARRQERTWEETKSKVRQIFEIFQQLESLGPSVREARLASLFSGNDKNADHSDYRRTVIKNMLSFTPDEMNTLDDKRIEWGNLVARGRTYAALVRGRESTNQKMRDSKLSQTQEGQQRLQDREISAKKLDKLHLQDVKRMEALSKEIIDMAERSPAQRIEWLDLSVDTPTFAPLSSFTSGPMTFEGMESDPGLVWKTEPSKPTRTCRWSASLRRTRPEYKVKCSGIYPMGIGTGYLVVGGQEVCAFERNHGHFGGHVIMRGLPAGRGEHVW